MYNKFSRYPVKYHKFLSNITTLFCLIVEHKVRNKIFYNTVSVFLTLHNYSVGPYVVVGCCGYDPLDDL